MNNNPDKENKNGKSSVRAEKTTLQKQYVFIVIAACLAVLFIIFYFAIYPLFKNKSNLLSYMYDGEAIDKYGMLCIVTPHERKEISRIEVKNSFGTYVLEAKDTAAGRDYELVGGGKAVLDSVSVAGVVTSAGQPLASAADSKNYRADEYATKDDLARYGLDEASDPSWFRVTLDNGTSYRILIGDVLSTGNGCYALLDDETRRNVVDNGDGTVSEYYIVYVLDATTSTTMLAGSTALVSTTIGTYVGNGIYSTEVFKVDRIVNGARSVVVSIKPNNVDDNLGNSAFKFEYPAAYIVNEDSFYNVLEKIASIEADAVMAMGDGIYNPEVYEKYGLDLDAERLKEGTDKNYAVFNYKCLTSSLKDTYENKLYFSEKQLLADGTYCYYVYSPNLDIIARVSADNFEFISWSPMKYTDSRIFFASISSLDYFSLLSRDGKTDYRFTLTGDAYTYHVDVTDAAGKNPVLDKDGDKLVFDVSYRKTNYETIFEGPFENFRDLYYVFITRMFDTNEDMLNVGDDENPVYNVEAQIITRDRSEQFYKYSNGNISVENGSYVTVIYDGGFMQVRNLTGTSANGYTLQYDTAYYDEKTGKYFVKAVDSADDELKPRNYSYSSDGKLIPIYLDITNATAEYTVTNYKYDFYNMYNEIKNADGTVTKMINQTYMAVVSSVTENVYRIEADGTRTLLSSKSSADERIASVIRKSSIEKLFSDASKVVAGESIDKTAVD